MPANAALDCQANTWMARGRLAWLKARAWVGRKTLDERLRLAIGAGQMGWADDLLVQGADINFAPVSRPDGATRWYCLHDPRERLTALHVACASGRFDVALWLLERGANTQLDDTWGTIPVQLAAAFGHAHIVALLASHGEDLSRGMPVYSTFVEDFDPLTVAEHMRTQGFEGDEHLRHMASRARELMQGKTREAGGSVGDDARMPARL